jgi:hypothetical protein
VDVCVKEIFEQLAQASGLPAVPWADLGAWFCGASGVQAAFTGFCPLAKILKAMGVKPGKAFD